MEPFTSPSVLAMNIIRYIGDHVSELQKPIKQLRGIAGAIGAPGNELADDLIEELEGRGLIKIGNTVKTFGSTAFININLTLEGWDQYEREKRGSFSGDYGFLAMQFGDSDLEAFVEEILKPTVEDAGYKLAHMRDVGRAGVIDNIMRVQIRDAAFVISDLTHDNSGAYWEGATQRDWVSRSFTFVKRRSSRKRALISTPITARPFSGPGVTTRTSAGS